MIQNWGRNLTYNAVGAFYPESLEEIQNLVGSHDKVKVLGTRHSFSDIADTDGVFISTQHLDRIVALDQDPNHPTVTVEAGIKYGQLCEFLNGAGNALSNLASLPHISVGGAVATATHGSGIGNGSLATVVSALTMVTADGSVRKFSRSTNPDIINGLVVGLGALGVVTGITLELVPAFEMRQEVYLNLVLDEALDRFEEIAGYAYSVSLFTDWKEPRFNQVWFKRRADDAGRVTLRSAAPATENVHPLAGHAAENCTEQLGVPGPWHERLPHFRMDFTPSIGDELQSEFFLAREHATAALEVIASMRESIFPILQTCEIRTVAKDGHWMSPAYDRDSVTIQFTWAKKPVEVMDQIPKIEAVLDRFDARPHWGKLFTMKSDRLRLLYPRFTDFQDLVNDFDKTHKFGNAFLERCIY